MAALKVGLLAPVLGPPQSSIYMRILILLVPVCVCMYVCLDLNGESWVVWSFFFAIDDRNLIAVEKEQIYTHS